MKATTWHAIGGQLVRRGRGPATPPAAVHRFPGDPNPRVTHQLWWGCSVQTNGDPGPHETAAGTTLAIRRRYWSSMSNVTVPNGALLTAVRADHAAARLPWVSFKVPTGDWAKAAAGGYDATFDALIAELESYAKPTWVILNHEPENDGGVASAWRGMQARFRARMNAHGNIRRLSFGSCLMAWTWDRGSGRNPNDWWAGDGVWDWHGADHYTEPDAEIMRAQFTAFVNFCSAKGIPFAVPEWGLRAADPNGVARMQSFFDAMTGGSYDCVALSFFDSTIGAAGTDPGWRLEGALADRFHLLMQDQRAIHLSDLGF